MSTEQRAPESRPESKAGKYAVIAILAVVAGAAAYMLAKTPARKHTSPERKIETSVRKAPAARPARPSAVAGLESEKILSKEFLAGVAQAPITEYRSEMQTNAGTASALTIGFSTRPEKAKPDGKMPDFLFPMAGNVVISDSTREDYDRSIESAGKDGHFEITEENDIGAKSAEVGKPGKPKTGRSTLPAMHTKSIWLLTSDERFRVMIMTMGSDEDNLLRCAKAIGKELDSNLSGAR